MDILTLRKAGINMKVDKLREITRDGKTVRVENTRVFDFTKGFFNAYDFKVNDLIYFILGLEICPQESIIKKVDVIKEEGFIKQFCNEFVVESTDIEIIVRFMQKTYHQIIYLYYEIDGFKYKTQLRFVDKTGFKVMETTITGNDDKEIGIRQTDHPTIFVLKPDSEIVINWNSCPYQTQNEFLLDKEIIKKIYNMETGDVFFVLSFFKGLDCDLNAEVYIKDDNGAEERITFSKENVRYVFSTKHFHLEILSGWKLRLDSKEYTDKSHEGLSEENLSKITEKLSKLDILKAEQ